MSSKPHTAYVNYSVNYITEVRTLLHLFIQFNNVAAICKHPSVRINESSAKQIITVWKEANRPDIDTYIHIDKRHDKLSIKGAKQIISLSIYMLVDWLVAYWLPILCGGRKHVAVAIQVEYHYTHPGIMKCIVVGICHHYSVFHSLHQSC